MNDVRYNCSYTAAPSTSQLMKNLNSRQKVIFWFAVSFLSFTLFFTFFNVYNLFKSNHHGFKLKKLLFIQNTYLMYASISFISLISPRSSVLGELVFSVYLSFTLKEFMNLVMRLLQMDNEVYDIYGAVSLSQPPLACCFCCLCPAVPLSRRFFRLIKAGILQAVFLRPFLNYIGAVVWVNGNSTLGIESPHEEIIDYINAVSVLVAMYCVALLFNGTTERDDPHELRIKYICIQLVCLISGLQHAILSTMSKRQLIPCDVVFNSQLRASDIHSFLVLGEMPLLLIISSFHKSPSICSCRRRNQFEFEDA